MGPDVMPLPGLPEISCLAGAMTAGLPFAAFSVAGLSQETLLVLATYIALAGAYLLVVPLALYWWMNRRWTLMGKLERTAVYGMVFLFFPGLILFAPFLNFRMAGSGDGQA